MGAKEFDAAVSRDGIQFLLEGAKVIGVSQRFQRRAPFCFIVTEYFGSN